MRVLRPDHSDPAPPSETVRAAVTVLLAIYFAGLALTVLVNTGSGGSALLSTIKGRLFTPWMMPMWLDLGFDYRLTDGQDDDAEHVLEVRPFAARGAAPLRRPDSRRGEQAARWRRLARATAAPSDDSDREAILPTAIARGLFDDLDDDDLLIRVMRLPLPDRGAAPGRPRQVSAVRVRRVGDEIQLIRQEARGEVAPVVTRPTAAPAGAAETSP
jgi:hypothetical protein